MFRCALELAAAVLFFSIALEAEATKYWKNSVVTGNWNAGNSWSAVSASGVDNAGVPVASDTVNIAFTDGTARTVTYDYNGNVITLTSLTIDLTNFGATTNTATLLMPNNLSLTSTTEHIGDSIANVNGRGTLTQSAGTNTVGSGNLYLAFNSTDSGTYNLSGTGTLTASGHEYVGTSGTGTFNQSGGTNKIDSSHILDLALNTTATGNYNLSGGTLNVASFEYIGDQGVGNFHQTGGTNFLSGSDASLTGLNIGYHNLGTYTLDNGTLTSNGYDTVGYSNTGIFTQNGGTHTVGGQLNLGLNVGSSGTYNLNGGSLLVTYAEILGFGGAGIFNQTGGTNSLPNQNLFIGSYSGSGTYNLSGGLATMSQSVVIGLPSASPSAQGVLNVSGTGSMTIGGSLVIYNNASGVNFSAGTINTAGLNFNGVPSLFNWTGGNLNITTNVNWDSTAAATSTSAAFGPSLTLSNGQTLQVTGNETIGGNGAFSLTLNSGSAHNVTGTITLAPTGTITQNAGSTLYAPTFTHAGGTVNGTLVNQGAYNYQSGTFNGRLINQGTLSIAATANFTLSDGVENDGTATVGAGQTLTANGFGLDNIGAFTLSGGVISGSGPVLNDFGGTMSARGTINPVLTNNGQLTITGALNLTNATGATNNGIFQGSGTVSGGCTNAAGGIVNVAVGSALAFNSAWSNFGLVMLQGGGAFLNGGMITNRGTIQGAGTIGAPVANSTGSIRASAGELDLAGAGGTNDAAGLIQASSNNMVMYVQGLAANSGTIGLSGGAFDNNNHPLANSGVVNGYGTIRTSALTNANRINVGEGNMDVFGSVINNGTIGIQSDRSIYFFGNESGPGGFTGAGTAVFLAAVSPGSSPAAVHFGGNVELSSTSTLNIELGGTNPGSEYDQLLVSGTFALGGALNVTLINGFTPSAGQSFNLFDWASTNGSFAALQLPAIAGLVWNTSQLYTTGVLILDVPGIPGDYNHNGVVDAADYVVWRKNQGTTNVLPNDPNGGVIGQAQYDNWRAHFGQTVGSGPDAIVSAAVPEPATSVLLLLAAAGVCSLRRCAA